MRRYLEALAKTPAMSGSALVLVSLLAPFPSTVAATTICLKVDAVDVAGKTYVVQNNVWNDVDNSQCLNVDPSTGAFSVTTANHNLATNGPPAAYPAIFKGCHWGNCTVNSGMPAQVSAMGATTSSWNTTQPASGVYDVAYDIWFNTTQTTAGQPDGAELMIWLNYRGTIQPIGSKIASSVSLVGSTWDVWEGRICSGPCWNVISYVNIPRLTSVNNLDIRAFTQDGVGRGYIQGGWYLIAIEAGFEPWQGVVGLASNSFSASVSGGGATPTATAAATATPTARPTSTATTPTGTNLALNRPATSSSSENSSYLAGNAVDGNTSTRWASVFSDPQWVSVDLGASYSVNRVRLNWEAAYARGYTMQVSADNINWTTIKTVTAGVGGIEDWTGLSGTGRYVRMYGTTRATTYGYSLWELEVYGNAGATATATATATPLVLDPNAWYKLTNKNSHSLLSVYLGGTNNNDQAMIYTDVNAADQFWQFASVGGGYYHIVNKKSGRLLSLTGGATTNGTIAMIYDNVNATDQAWSVQPGNANGYWKLSNQRRPGGILSVVNAGTANNSRAQLYDDLGHDDQSWTISP